MHSRLPAVDGLFASRHRVHFNLGNIGLLASHQAGPDSPWAFSGKSFHGALVHANPGLLQPARDLDAMLLRVPEEMPLALLSARHHGVAYHFICDLQARSARAALQFACDIGRLHVGFMPDGGVPTWSAMNLEQQTREVLEERLASHKSRRGRRDESWRDRLGLLLLSLPVLLAEADSQAGNCTYHSAVLLRGGR